MSYLTVIRSHDRKVAINYYIVMAAAAGICVLNDFWATIC